MKENALLTIPELNDCLAKIKDARVAVIGDFCLDVYWKADMRLSELSRETPHHPLPIVEESYAPGGAGNVAANVAALEPKNLIVKGVIGNDWRGEVLKEALREKGVDDRHFSVVKGRTTNCYIKPLRMGISDVVYEDPRLDFEARMPLDRETEDEIIADLTYMANEADVILVCDQMRYGIITDRVREAICSLGKQGKTFIVDSRDRVALYQNVIVKPNEVEAMRAFGGSDRSIDTLFELVKKISARNEAPALITLGEYGCVVTSDSTTAHCPACPVEPPIDFCGAGDTFLAGFGTALAAGIDPVTAAKFANFCSSVTIKKLNTTGTATPGELQTEAMFRLI